MRAFHRCLPLSARLGCKSRLEEVQCQWHAFRVLNHCAHGLYNCLLTQCSMPSDLPTSNYCPTNATRSDAGACAQNTILSIQRGDLNKLIQQPRCAQHVKVACVARMAALPSMHAAAIAGDVVP